MPRRVRASLSQRAAVLRLMGRGALYHHARPCSLLCNTAPNGGAASQSMEPLTPTAHRQRARLNTSFVVQRNSSTRQLVLLDAQHLKSYWLAEGTCVRKSDQSVGRSNMFAGASSRKCSASRAAGQWRAHRMASLWPILGRRVSRLRQNSKIKYK